MAAAAGVTGEKLAVGRIAAGDSVALAGTMGTADASTMRGRARGNGTRADFGAALEEALAADLACFGFAVCFAGAPGLAAAGFVSAGFAAAGLVSAGLAALAFLSSGLAREGAADPPNASAVAITYPRYRR